MLNKLKRRLKIFEALIRQAPGGLNGSYNDRKRTKKLTRIAAWSHVYETFIEWGRRITLKELFTGKVDRSDKCQWHLIFDLDKGEGTLEDIDFDGCCYCPTYRLRYSNKDNKVKRLGVNDG